MLSIERTRELLAEFDLSNSEVEDMQVLSWLLAGVAFDAWQKRQKIYDTASTSPVRTVR